jgi:hypothetical protein
MAAAAVMAATRSRMATRNRRAATGERPVGTTSAAVVAAVALACSAAGCGGDDENEIIDDLIPPPPPLVLNELMALNNSIIADPADGNFDDWIELWNPGPNPVSTSGFYLSDDFAAPDWALPDTTLPVGGYLLVWADNETAQGRWHANFQLGGAGDEAVLVYAMPVGFSLVDSVTFGAQASDTSYARFPDGGAWMQDSTPTPAAANE